MSKQLRKLDHLDTKRSSFIASRSHDLLFEIFKNLESNELIELSSSETVNQCII